MSPITSLGIYESRCDYEQVAYANRSTLCMLDGRIKKLSYAAARELHISYLYDEVDELLADHQALRIVEVGCGNCINSVLLKRRYAKRVELVGHDISRKRIEVAKSYFGAELNESSLLYVRQRIRHQTKSRTPSTSYTTCIALNKFRLAFLKPLGGCIYAHDIKS